MKATIYEILDKTKWNPFAFVDINDFQLRETGETDAAEIVGSDQITLYALDFENGRAVFVETPSEIDLNQAPFYYVAQYENALRVLMIPFETMFALAETVAVDDSKLIVVYSTGRAGSTLAGKILANVPGIINFSEPDVTTQIAVARSQQPENESYLIQLLDVCVRLLCKREAETGWVIKGRSFAVEIADWLHKLYPQAKNVFLYREASGYMLSGLRAFLYSEERTANEIYNFEKEIRAMFTPVAPLLAQYDPEEHLNAAGVTSLLWLSVMERVTRLQEAGMEFLGICYQNWRSAPKETAVAMLEYCGCLPEDLSCVYEALAKDSQAGSPVAQETIGQQDRELQERDLQELQRHLQAHPFIKTAAYEVANTLQL